MKLKIKNIVLYPKDKSKDKRIISFELEKVNVITGESHKGKSALVHVIDYCLGSEKCSIPVGYIRDLTDWFGVHVIAEKTELLILRKEPGDKISTDKMIMVESSEPIDIDKITNAENHQANREQVINRLNQLSGLSTERIDLDNPRNGFGGSASFRDTSAFQFQPQHIVANPYVLFYKADTYEHQQKLKSIFPLFIGAITNEALNIEREIKELEVSFKKLQSELATKKQAVESWKNDLKAHFNRAIQLGLLKSIPDASQNFDAKQYLFYLNLVISDFNASPIPVYQTGTSEKDVQLQLDLNSLERTLQSEIASRKIRLTKLQSLNASTTQYKETVVTHQKRLEPVSWFKEKINHEYCLFASQRMKQPKSKLNLLMFIIGR
ncbi:MAG: hypothetical protein IPK96_16405 [Flammeovirgaceae bacterium]|nr:hypothetical protein [Flammeovirgaceae bacterium]